VWDHDTDSVRNVLALAEIGDPRPHFDLAGSALPFPFWFRLWAVCTGDDVRVYDRLRNEVHRFTGDGVELAAITLPTADDWEVTRAQYARAMFRVAAMEAAGAVPSSDQIEVPPSDSAEIMDGFMSRVDASPEQLANLLPRYTDLRCDEKGTLWMQPVRHREGPA
jgi:hypothetical protein